MPWLQVRLAITPDQAETYEDALLEVGAVSVTFMDAEDQPIFEPDLGTTPLWSNTHLLALFEADTDETNLVAHLELLTGGALPEHQIERIEDQDWERSWMDNFQPMRFGRRLWIVPSWHEAPEPDAVNLLLDPGLAFGTGTHPTTRMCLRWLAAHPPRGQRVLDYGCGSGILAIGAALHGAAGVDAVDIDPAAVQATQDNAAANGVALRAGLPELAQGVYDTVLANILATPLKVLAPLLAAHVAPGGTLVLAGVLERQTDELRQAYRSWLALEVADTEDGWVLLVARRP